MTALVECVSVTAASCSHGPRRCDEKGPSGVGSLRAPWLAGEPRRTTGTGAGEHARRRDERQVLEPTCRDPAESRQIQIARVATRAPRVTSPWPTENELTGATKMPPRQKAPARRLSEPDRAETWKSSASSARRRCHSWVLFKIYCHVEF